MAEIWTNRRLPADWGISRITTLWKNKGKKSDPSKYRGLSISSAICKLCMSIILAREKSWLQQIAMKRKKRIYACFIDLKAAFDKIMRTWLFQSIYIRMNPGQDGKIDSNFQIIEELYKKTTAYMTDDPDKKEFDVGAGVRQGGSESPSLYNLYMDFVMRVFKVELEKAGIKGVAMKFRIPNHGTNRSERAKYRSSGVTEHLWVGFADDTTLFFESVEDMQAAMNILVDIFDRYRLMLNEDKTETMIFDPDIDAESDYPKNLIEINGFQIKNVQKFRFLGSHIKFNEVSTGEHEINIRLEAAKCKFAELENLLTNFKIKLKTRMVFYNAYVKSRMTYACQTWNLSDKLKRKLDSAHHQFLRRMVCNGFARIDREKEDFRFKFTNEKIRQFCCTTTLLEFIERQQIKFAAHICRQQNSRHTKQLMFNDDKYHRGGNFTKPLLQQAASNAVPDASEPVVEFVKVPYNEKVVENLIRVLELGYRNGSQVRVVTLEMLIILLKEIVMHTVENKRYSYLNDRHLAMIENVREASTLQLRHYYKEDEIFLDMFEDEYRQSKVKPLNLQHFMMDAALLLPPTGTPLTGIEFYKRLPCGEVEHTRRAIRVFLLMRDLCLALLGQSEKSLPLSKIENSVNLEDVLDLNNSDLIACTVRLEEKQQRRFLVIDEAQFILVEPDTTKLGWGVVKFVARLQDVETAPDKEDSRSLFITIHQPSSVRSLTKVRSRPILSAKFIFDDYIRCMSAKQRLQRRRGMLRQHKLHCIAQLLELPAMASPPSHYYSITPPAYVNLGPGQLDSPTDSQTSESVEERSGQQRQSFELPQLPSDAPKESLSSVQTPLASAMATPEQCLSPVHCQGRRTTSQAEALANVLEQSPPDNKVPTAPKPRACSLEDATEAIELQHTNGDSDTVVRTTPFDINSRSRSHSMENIPRPGFINKPLSQSAPATPRGDRRALSISFEDEETTVRVNSMSEPAIFLSSQWDSPSAHAQHPEKKTKKTRGKKAKGKTRQRKK
ncbi:Protein CLEC16A [Acropora cervicornis]|uniref:Protein CLEC16A n=1 Tax=Acropora cervicornis TaxID=6130 RepID=A0AAD9Q9H6_ACRCE|nr:Protein CLEC16A [Acropora cervicornis]